MAWDTAISSHLFKLGEALPSWLVVFLGTFLIWFLVAGILAFGIFLRSGKSNFFKKLSAAAIIAFGINALIGLVYFRARPFVSLDGLLSSVSLSAFDGSFPSDHAAVAWAMAAAVYLKNKKIGVWFLLIAFLIALARALGGVHYILDVSAGAAIGYLAAYFVSRRWPSS